MREALHDDVAVLVCDDSAGSGRSTIREGQNGAGPRWGDAEKEQVGCTPSRTVLNGMRELKHATYGVDWVGNAGGDSF